MYWIPLLSTLSSVIPILLGSTKRSLLLEPIKIIIALISVSLIFDLIMMTMALNGIRNIFFSHIYNVAEIMIVGCFYWKVLKFKKIVFALSLLTTSVYLLNLLLLDSEIYNDLGKTFEALIFISFSIGLFYEIYKNEELLFIEHSYLFWINIALLVYFSGSFFSFLLSKEILNGPLPWAFHNIANILKNILFAIGLWKVRATA